VAISDDPAERFQAYAESHIWIGHPILGVLQVCPEASGIVVGEFPDPAGRTIHVLTAHNPGRQLSDAENVERHARLSQWLQRCPGLAAWPAEGGDARRSHCEESFAIVGMTDADACALATSFDQEAVFAWRPTELVVLSCQDGSSVTRGWSVTLVRTESTFRRGDAAQA
jgi:hypothetical protein